jgi:DNA-directed RNA polymerase subunit H
MGHPKPSQNEEKPPGRVSGEVVSAPTPPASRFNVLNHVNVPLHELLTDAEAKAVLKTYGATKEQLPKIRSNDPVVQVIAKGANRDSRELAGSLIRVTRNSPTAGRAVAYRVIVEAL